jgi:protein-tyrosine phosphatase
VTATSERFLAFAGVHNFRDLGGYRGQDGRPVRMRRLFRADAPTHLSEQDGKLFADLGIHTVLDLRRAVEVERAGRVAGAEGRRYVNVHPTHEGLAWESYDPGIGIERFLADRYLSMATATIGEFGTALTVVADPDSAPLVMHCHAGRDRTGVLAALVLALLGVDDDRIAEDYALSAEGMRRYYAWHRRTGCAEPLPPPHGVASPREAMTLFLDRLRERFGGVQDYAAAAGVSAAAIRALRGHMLDA